MQPGKLHFYVLTLKDQGSRLSLVNVVNESNTKRRALGEVGEQKEQSPTLWQGSGKMEQ